MKHYILTGTPGCGKSSVIQNLAARNFHVVVEAATDVIAQQQALGIASPWEDQGFIDEIIAVQHLRQVEAARSQAKVVFYDRSPICTYALAVYLAFEPSPVLVAEINRIKDERVYEPQVFFLENLGFCEPTAARKISFEQSLVFEKIHFDAYIKFGYQPVVIPRTSLSERTEWIVRAASVE